MDSDAVPTPVRLAVAVEVDEGVAEVVADAFFAHGASAVAEQPGATGRCTLVGDLTPEQLAAFQADPLREALDVGTPRVLEPEVAWHEGWREFARSWRCGPRVVLRPAWVAPDPALAVAEGGGPAIELVMEPGVAFGSGSHPTTRLCVAAVDQLVVGGERVLDVGCGTGVLGVAALLVGAASVTAIDVDPEALRVTDELGRLNGVGSRLQVRDVDLAGIEGTFDLVLANLLLPIIEALGEQLVQRVAPGGHLVASGVLVGQQDRTVAALAPLRLESRTEDAGWLTLVLART